MPSPTNKLPHRTNQTEYTNKDFPITPDNKMMTIMSSDMDSSKDISTQSEPGQISSGHGWTLPSSLSSLAGSDCDDCSDTRTMRPCCSQPANRPAASRPFGSCLPRMVLVLSALALFLSPSHQTTFEISAYEYHRMFGHYLEIGDCPMRMVTYNLTNSSVINVKSACALKYRGFTIKHFPRWLEDKRNVEIKGTQDIITQLGICGGEAASFLGVLNTGDCLAVDIANKLIFNDRTLVRAYVQYYRTSVDHLVKNDTGPIDIDSYRDMNWLQKRYYLQSLSYGTMEVVFVQFRFRYAADAKNARQVALSSPKMSDYMMAIKARVGEPKSLVVIGLSTASDKPYSTQRFKATPDDPKFWERALMQVKRREHSARITILGLERNKPHLKYHMDPFLNGNADVYRVSNPLWWERVSILEVKITKGLAIAKKTKRKCLKSRTIACHQVRGALRSLKKVKKIMHQQRAKWVEMTDKQKSVFMTKSEAAVDSHDRIVHKLAQEIKALLRQEKMNRLKHKLNGSNQIPDTADDLAVKPGYGGRSKPTYRPQPIAPSIPKSRPTNPRPPVAPRRTTRPPIRRPHGLPFDLPTRPPRRGQTMLPSYHKLRARRPLPQPPIRVQAVRVQPVRQSPPSFPTPPPLLVRAQPVRQPATLYPTPPPTLTLPPPKSRGQKLSPAERLARRRKRKQRRLERLNRRRNRRRKGNKQRRKGKDRRRKGKGKAGRGKLKRHRIRHERRRQRLLKERRSL